MDIIAGDGQIGTSLEKVLSPFYEVTTIGKGDTIPEGDVDFLHICFPHSEEFEDEVKRYQENLNPDYTVIHSTVPVGTSRKLNAVNSPIRGKHPDLSQSIKTFVKFVGGEDAEYVADHLRYVGIKTSISRKPETTELGKLLSTTYYGLCIEFAKEAENLCDNYGVPFSEAYTLFQQTYNEGYDKMGHPEVKRPILDPMQKKIGGHCILPNAQIFTKSRFAKFLRKLNEV